MNPDRASFGHDTTTDEVLAGIDLTGKLALVTGGASGLGTETARALAARGARVLVTARDREPGEKIAAALRASTGNPAIDAAVLDLASIASTRHFARAFLDRHDRLDLLINNAGVMACPQAKTRDGFELQFGTNHLGHFLLTVLLAPALLRAAPARVVSLSSSGHRLSPVVFDDIHYERRPYDKWEAYGQSKTANALLAVELDRRLGPRGVRAFAVHPGAILTNLGRHMDAADFERINERAPGGRLRLKSIEAGAATTVFAATARQLEGRGGCYLEDCGIAVTNDDEDAGAGVRSWAVDPEAAERLWEVSQTAVGATFDPA
jgi:NAD(P)-dependent dehydrogenase (short-subunit alcohol dehydrogenase family)